MNGDGGASRSGIEGLDYISDRAEPTHLCTVFQDRSSDFRDARVRLFKGLLLVSKNMNLDPLRADKEGRGGERTTAHACTGGPHTLAHCQYGQSYQARVSKGGQETLEGICYLGKVRHRSEGRGGVVGISNTPMWRSILENFTDWPERRTSVRMMSIKCYT